MNFNMDTEIEFIQYLVNSVLEKMEEDCEIFYEDYDMMDYLSRTHKKLIVTLKNGDKVESTVGPFYNDLIFNGKFPDSIANANYAIQKKAFDTVQIVG